MKNIPVITIVGAHNSGKTTFISKVIKTLSSEGYKICAVKHDPKGKAKTDTEGKDSYKMYHAGAGQVILASPDKITSYIREENYTLDKILKNYIIDDTDIVIVEGFKWAEGLDKFEVIRKEENRDLMLKNSPDLKGVITDYFQFEPSFDINKPEQFVEFIKKNYLKSI
jgi:molybdopterin-guanine dinucleotide biosynthesis protein B